MEIKKVGEFEFVNESKNTRNGFAHVTTLFKNGYELSNNKCNYLNRTWESYRYQTSMKGCVRSLIDARKAKLKSDFMTVNMYGRMTAKRSEELAKIINADRIVSEYRNLYDSL